jgi:RimJ/RimL family protein N-acetyltransferase
MNQIETERLLLRGFQEQDVEPFVRMHQDPKMLEFLPPSRNAEEVKAWMQKGLEHIKEHGFGPWAITLKETGQTIGVVGLNFRTDLPFSPCVEIGWRIASEYWGKGYATEAARAVIKEGFTTYHLPEIVSFTSPTNVRSIRVMEKLGMQRDPQGDFHHTRLPKDHPLSWHVLYRIKNTKNNNEL